MTPEELYEKYRMPELPETHTVSTRLTLYDYQLFRDTCERAGYTMHTVIRMLVASYLVGMNMSPTMPLYKAYFRDQRRKRARRILPYDVSI